MKRIAASYIPKFLLAFAIVMLTACTNDDADSRVDKVKVGDEVPAFLLTAADGTTVSPSSLSGQVYLLSFFDTGCPDCRKELPVLQQIHDKYSGSVPVINVPRSQTVSEVRQYWSQAELSMPVYTPNDKGLYYKFADSGIPRIYIVDGSGIVQAVFTDSPLVDFNTIDTLLQGLLQTESAKQGHGRSDVQTEGASRHTCWR